MNATPDDDARCPCCSGAAFGDCCGPILAGRLAPSPEMLMRSRFTAFALADTDHLHVTWHPDTCPEDLELDDQTQWYRLDVEATRGGSPFEKTGEVTFTAHFRAAGERGRLHERSRFVRVDGRWLYVDGIVTSS